jgi:hypothetical protein
MFIFREVYLNSLLLCMPWGPTADYALKYTGLWLAFFWSIGGQCLYFLEMFYLERRSKLWKNSRDQRDKRQPKVPKDIRLICDFMHSAGGLNPAWFGSYTEYSTEQEVGYSAA